MMTDVTPLTAEEWKELRDDPRMVHLYDANRIVGLLDAARSETPGLREALITAGAGYHHSCWDAEHQNGHTNADWNECMEWPCRDLTRVLRAALAAPTTEGLETLHVPWPDEMTDETR